MKTTTTSYGQMDAGGRQDTEEHPLVFAARAVDRFFFEPSEPTTLGLMRIATGVLILYMHFAHAINLTDYFGPYAWVGNDVTKFVRHDYFMQALPSNWKSDLLESDGEIFYGQPAMWSIYYHVEDPKWVWAIHIGIMIAALLFTLGLWTRVTSVLTWIGSLMYIHRLMQPGMLFGMDTMTNIGLFYLMFAPCGAALSLDRWLQVRRERQRLGAKYVPQPPQPRVSATFATRLLQINFCMIYFAAGTSKLQGASWWNGTAPNGFLLNYSFAPFDVPRYVEFLKWLVAHRWLWELNGTFIVVYTLILELGFPFLVWNHRTRWLMVCGSVLLHTGIALLMGLVTFSLMMLVLVLSFVPPEAVRQSLLEWEQSLRQLWQRWARSEAKTEMALSR